MAFVQKKGIQTQATATSQTLTLDGAVGSGGLIAGIVSWGSATDLLSSISCGNGTAIVLDVQADTQGDTIYAKSFYIYNITNAPTTVVANFSSTVIRRAISAIEFSGRDTAAPLDQHATATMSAATGTDGVQAPNGSDVTPTTDNQDVFAGGMHLDLSETVAYYTVGTGYSNFLATFNSGSRPSQNIESLTQTTATAVRARFTTADAVNDNYAFIMTFKVASASDTLWAQSVM